MEHMFGDELAELRLTAEETQSVLRTGSLAVVVAIAVFAVVMAF